jgi:hypothetical protein
MKKKKKKRLLFLYFVEVELLALAHPAHLLQDAAQVVVLARRLGKVFELGPILQIRFGPSFAYKTFSGHKFGKYL